MGKEVLALGVAGLEDVVPIVLGGTEAAKRGVQSDHLFRHGVTGGVGIKTTIDGKALGITMQEANAGWAGLRMWIGREKQDGAASN